MFSDGAGLVSIHGKGGVDTLDFSAYSAAHPVMVNLTDRYYNPEDEGRLPYDHPDIAYDWEIQHK